MRDYQKQRVYDWERQWIRPRIADSIPFETAVAVGLHIWSELGLQYPPQFKPLAKQTRNFGGKANRMAVWLPEMTSTATVIHEIAHSLTCDIDGNSARHGPEFVGMMMKLIDRFTPLSIPEMMYTLSQTKIDYNLGATPAFINR